MSDTFWSSIKTASEIADERLAQKRKPELLINHELKSWVGLFEPIFQGLKTHDLRVLDRDYKVGDICILREYEPITKEYTGREVVVEVTYITSKLHEACAFSPFALHPGMGVLSIKLKQYRKERGGRWFSQL